MCNTKSWIFCVSPFCGLAQEMRVEPKDLFTSEKAVWLRGVQVIKGETEASEASTGMTSGQCWQIPSWLMNFL